MYVLKSHNSEIMLPTNGDYLAVGTAVSRILHSPETQSGDTFTLNREARTIAHFTYLGLGKLEIQVA